MSWIRQDARYVSDGAPKRVIANGVRFAICDGNGANWALARTCATERGRVSRSVARGGNSLCSSGCDPWPSPRVATESRSHRLGTPSLNGGSGGTLLSAAIAMTSLELRLQGTAMAVTISRPGSSTASLRRMGDRVACGFLWSTGSRPAVRGRRPHVHPTGSATSAPAAHWDQPPQVHRVLQVLQAPSADAAGTPAWTTHRVAGAACAEGPQGRPGGCIGLPARTAYRSYRCH